MQELFDAISSADDAAIKTALAKAGNPSAILLSLYYGRNDLARMLVDRGATLTFPEACAVGDMQRVRHLLQGDASLVNAFSDDGFPALGLAIFFRQPAVARELIERGADVNAAASNAQMVAPIHAAASVADRDIVRLLLERGANPDARQEKGFVALHTAALHGDVEMAQMLLDHGADPKTAADDGTTAEEFARQKGHEQFVEWFRTMY